MDERLYNSGPRPTRLKMAADCEIPKLSFSSDRELVEENFSSPLEKKTHDGNNTSELEVGMISLSINSHRIQYSVAQPQNKECADDYSREAQFDNNDDDEQSDQQGAADLWRCHNVTCTVVGSTDDEGYGSHLPLLHSYLDESESTKACFSFSSSKRLELMCPLYNSNIVSSTCDHNGGALTSKDGDINVIIPKGAVEEGHSIIFYIATGLYGPFILPSQCQTDLASPYYWIRVTGSYHFQKPVQVEFEHYGACDPSHYQLLSCEDDDESYTMRRVDYDLSFTVRDDNIAVCTFQTCHFCSYCLFHGCKDPKINRIVASYLKPANFKNLNHFTVEIWFNFPINHCYKRNKELYTNKGMILDTDCTSTFEASTDENSRSYFALSYGQTSEDWCVGHLRFQEISTKEVNFYNYYTNMCDLKANEENSQFPPRFIIDVLKNSDCKTDLNTSIAVTLHGDVKTKSATFKLFVSTSLSFDKPRKNSFPSTVCHCTCSVKLTPKFKELIEYSAKISAHWKRIALQLSIPEWEVTKFDLDHPNNVNEKCYDMLTFWLQQEISPCWCHFAQALRAVGLNRVAEEVETRLQNSSDDDSAIVTPSSDMGESSYSLKDKENTINLYLFVMFLKNLPEEDFKLFVLHLLPRDNALVVIRDIRCNSNSKMDKISKIGEAFLKEKDPSWIKVYTALKEAECDDLAAIIETCFLPL